MEKEMKMKFLIELGEEVTKEIKVTEIKIANLISEHPEEIKPYSIVQELNQLHYIIRDRMKIQKYIMNKITKLEEEI